VRRAKNPVESFRYALNGVLLSYKTQRHLRIHFVLALLVLLAGFAVRLTRTELALLVCVIALVVMAELFNTALETVVDLVTTDYHPLAKVAKDVAAGAVLVAAMTATLVGLLLFLRPEEIGRRIQSPPEYEDALQTCVIGFLMLLILLVIWKVRGGKGRFLQGGVVSGHSAIAFFLCSVVLLVAENPLIAFLAVLLALLVAQSRVETEVHTLREVLFGALLGILIPVVLYRAIPLVLQLVVVRSLGAGR